MDHSTLFQILCERLTPALLNYLQISFHSITIWDNISSHGAVLIHVIYDRLDIITALWVNDSCYCRGGGQIHLHLCPSKLRTFWAEKLERGEEIKLPYRITFSPREVRPYDCPHLNELRLARDGRIRDVLRQRVCLLPGPRSTNLIRPPPTLQRGFPNLAVLPGAQLVLPRPLDLAVGE